MYENDYLERGDWVAGPTSGPLPGDMKGKACGSGDDGIQRTRIFVAICHDLLCHQRTMKMARRGHFPRISKPEAPRGERRGPPVRASIHRS